ncbi:MAG: hypothetical protein ACHQ2Z_00460 [Elusimicrobiota bacterium]
MIAALLLAAALSAPARAATVKLFCFNEKGAALGLPGLLSRLARADDKHPAAGKAAFWAFPLDAASAPSRVRLGQLGPLVTATWPGGAARLELVWPVKDDGYSEVRADNGGNGFDDGAAVFLDEEIAMTQYRLFKESLARRASDSAPAYEIGKKAKGLAEDAKKAMADATREKEAPKRAAAFQEALRLTAQAWERSSFEYGLQLGTDERRAGRKRFGLTLDESLLKRLDELDWLAKEAAGAGNWVRVVFRPNGGDFTYASGRSFNEYDGALKALRGRKLKIIGTILDTAQWPKTLTPEAYAARVRNIVLHYKGQVSTWEIGSEINGDWLGGASAPLDADRVFEIYSAGAAAARDADADAERMATLYWWESTAPDRTHSLSGWLARYVPRGFDRSVDVVGLDLFPEDNPVGMGLEQGFDAAAAALPKAKLLLSSFGYVEKNALKGYWWLSPDDVDGARADLAVLYTTASCALRDSLCGGFWWQALDQMLPPGRRVETELYKADARVVKQLSR